MYAIRLFPYNFLFLFALYRFRKSLEPALSSPYPGKHCPRYDVAQPQTLTQHVIATTQVSRSPCAQISDLQPVLWPWGKAEGMGWPQCTLGHVGPCTRGFPRPGSSLPTQSKKGSWSVVVGLKTGSSSKCMVSHISKLLLRFSSCLVKLKITSRVKYINVSAVYQTVPSLVAIEIKLDTWTPVAQNPDTLT